MFVSWLMDVVSNLAHVIDEALNSAGSVTSNLFDLFSNIFNPAAGNNQ